jgi:hypothetical protein
MLLQHETAESQQNRNRIIAKSYQKKSEVSRDTESFWFLTLLGV